MQEIFRLVKYAQFTPEYVESITPLDRKLYIAYWFEDQKEQTKQEGQFTPLDDNIPMEKSLQDFE